MKTACLPLMLCLAALCAPVHAQDSGLGEVAFRQALRDLGNDLRLMCVAAHPDDEDGATLAYYRLRYGVETHAVIATRGEGGQNEIGPELYNELGVIRTREMQEAAKIEGAVLHFLNLKEFGFSKTLEEAQAIWGKDETVKRLVRVIRQVQPQVIITHHGRLKDHGQHQAIGAALLEAFDAAADPTRFPELLNEGLLPWTVWRLYIRDFGGGAEKSVAVDIGEFDPLRGTTYAEVAAQALRAHKSQGMETFIERLLGGHPKAYYDLVKNAPVTDQWKDMKMDAACGAFFDGVPHLTQAARREFSASRAPRGEMKLLLEQEATRASRARTNSAEAKRLWQKANDAASRACDFRLRAWVEDKTMVPGQAVKVHAVFEDLAEPDINNAAISIQFNQGVAVAPMAKQNLDFDAGHRGETVLEFTLPPNAPLTLPPADHLFDADFLAPQIDVVVDAITTQAAIELRAPVYFDVAPPVALQFSGAPYLVRAGDATPLHCSAVLTNYGLQARDEPVIFTASEGWALAGTQHQVHLAGEDAQHVVGVAVTPPADLKPGDYHVTAFCPGVGAPVNAAVRVVDLALPKDARVGVIQSYDDSLVSTLGKMGIAHAALTLSDFTPERLDAFTAIIVDIRAYLVRKDLVANNAALLDYVQRGGRLIVMYQKTFEWKPEYAPFPLRVSTNRVTKEDAPIKILAPEHGFFKMPNAIGLDDWNGWIQERGLYFPDQFDKAYTPLIACGDPGEDIPPGALLVAKHGKGTYVYTALVWYRQLRALNPGALRLFANLLAI